MKSFKEYLQVIQEMENNKMPSQSEIDDISQEAIFDKIAKSTTTSMEFNSIKEALKYVNEKQLEKIKQNIINAINNQLKTNITWKDLIKLYK
jgi:YesN/AraC family two-component response regulator